MKNIKAKILKAAALILIAFIIAGAGAACGGDAQKSADSGGDINNLGNIGADQSPEAEQAEEKILPDLPEVSYDGYTFTFLAHREGTAGWDWVTEDPRELIAEEENSEPINDAVYRRNSVIKERYGIEIDMLTDTGEVTLLRRAVNAGDDIYDAAIIFNNNVPGAVTANLLTEISQLPYLDLNKPWWDPGVNSMSVANKQFLLAGDLLILDNEATNAIIFNKDLMADLGMELPYNSVGEGKWTMDKMIEMTRGAESDLNGDGKMSYEDDRYGFITFNDTLQALLVAGGGAFAEKDKDDIPFMSFMTPKNLSVLEKAMDLMYTTSNTGVFNVQSVSAGSGNVTWMRAYYDTFTENRALFMWIRMRVVEVFRGMESNFGILPMPKFNDAQDRYYSLVNPYTGVMMGVPKSAGDLERTSVILEALSAESKYTLQPAYYDIVLNRKFTRDEESSEMLDIIFTTQVYDIGGVYSFGSVFSDFCDLASRENRDIISYHERKSSQMERAIEKVVEQFENME